MNKENSFANKTVLVTGAGSGIGRAAALAFAARGADVVVSDIQDDGGLNTARMIQEQFGRRSLYVHCDVSNDQEVQNLVAKTIDSFGRLDCAFNNAGIEGETSPLDQITEKNWDRVLNTNLKSVWLCMKYEIPHLLKRKGAIVNCASIAGLVGFEGSAPYVASKHGIVGLTKTAALEYAKSGLRVNAVCPGVIQTPMIDRVAHKDPAMQKALEAQEPVGRMGRPEEIANAVIWLCSEEASFVTGVALPVDGGWVAR